MGSFECTDSVNFMLNLRAFNEMEAISLVSIGSMLKMSSSFFSQDEIHGIPINVHRVGFPHFIGPVYCSTEKQRGM